MRSLVSGEAQRFLGRLLPLPLARPWKAFPTKSCRRSMAMAFGPPAGGRSPMGRGRGTGRGALGHGAESVSGRQWSLEALAAGVKCPAAIIGMHGCSCPTRSVWAQKRRWRRQWALTTGPAHWHRHGIQTFKAWQEESRGTWEAWDAWGLVECKVAWSSHGGREACSRRGMQAWRHAVSGGMPSWRHAVMEACVSGSPLVAQRMRLCGCRGHGGMVRRGSSQWRRMPLATFGTTPHSIYCSRSLWAFLSVPVRQSIVSLLVHGKVHAHRRS